LISAASHLEKKENIFEGRQQLADYKLTKKYNRSHPEAS
jgi:hypothetical protein